MTRVQRRLPVGGALGFTPYLSRLLYPAPGTALGFRETKPTGCVLRDVLGQLRGSVQGPGGAFSGGVCLQHLTLLGVGVMVVAPWHCHHRRVSRDL